MLCCIAQVYLYVTASKRVVGCVMLQSIQSACIALPLEDTAASTANSSACELADRLALSCPPQSADRQLGSESTARLQREWQPRKGVFPSTGLSAQQYSDTLATGRSVLREPARTLPQSAGGMQSMTSLGASLDATRCGDQPASSAALCHKAPVKSRKRSYGSSGLPSSKRATLGRLGTPDPQAMQRLQRQQSVLSGWLASAQKAPSQQVIRLSQFTCLHMRHVVKQGCCSAVSNVNAIPWADCSWSTCCAHRQGT